MTTTHLEGTVTCPACMKPLDGATSLVQGQRPGPDDASICIYCGTLLAFTHDMHMRLLLESEYPDLPPWFVVRVAFVRAAIAALEANPHAIMPPFARKPMSVH